MPDNFYSDNQDLQFRLAELDLAEAVETLEEGYRFHDEFAAARRAANMDGWQDNEIYGKLPLMVESVKMPPLDESYKSLAPMTK